MIIKQKWLIIMCNMISRWLWDLLSGYIVSCVVMWFPRWLCNFSSYMICSVDMKFPRWFYSFFVIFFISLVVIQVSSVVIQVSMRVPVSWMLLLIFLVLAWVFWCCCGFSGWIFDLLGSYMGFPRWSYVFPRSLYWFPRCYIDFMVGFMDLCSQKQTSLF